MTRPVKRNELSRRLQGAGRPPRQQPNSDLDGQVREFGQSILAWIRGEPLVCLLAAGSVGYAVGWLAIAQPADSAEPLPDYARKRA